MLHEITTQAALVRSAEGWIQTEPFLGLCRLVLPVVDKLGTAFTLVRVDISGNIERLAAKAATDKDRYAKVFAIVQDELIAGTHQGSSSCTKGLLWLKRAMEFMIAIIKTTLAQPQTSLAQVVADTYKATLMQYHGFMVSTAFTLAFKFVPAREVFLENIASGSEEAVNQQVQEFVSAFEPILQEIHQFLVDNDLDDPTKV